MAIDLATIRAAGDRAARYRRHAHEGPERPFELEQIIYFEPAATIRQRPDGWAGIGTVADSPYHLDVWWHERTNKVRVERAPERKILKPATPQMVGPPLYRTPRPSTKGDRFPFTATLGYIYTFEGVDYDHDAAEWLTAEQGGIEGWTWRKR